MAPIGNRYAGTVDFLAESFLRHLGGRAQVRVQSPIRLGEYSEPQPDTALLKRRLDFSRSRHSGPEDVLLVVEGFGGSTWRRTDWNFFKTKVNNIGIT